MKTIAIDTQLPQAGFQNALVSTGRAPEIPESCDVYGWLVGSWELDIYYYREDISARGLKGEVHFMRVLEGRAVQDIWIMPRRSERPAGADTFLNTYGTTIRVWDPGIQAWRVTWINPTTGSRDELVGRWSGEDIVQLGTHADGKLIRWCFTEITPDSFHWTGEVLQPDGKTWKLEAGFRGKRIRL